MKPIINKWWLALEEIFLDTLRLLPVVAFLFISSVPSESLAFVEYVELSHQPLEFINDRSLANTAIVGIEKFPKTKTVGGLLNSASSRIPTAKAYLKEGSAVRVLATAYSSTADQTDGNPFITASGTPVHEGIIATNFLPFGAKVRIGNQIYIVEDRMNSRYNGKYIIDIWQPTRAIAIQFGVKVLEMEIVSMP